jgi:hypothetical protein
VQLVERLEGKSLWTATVEKALTDSSRYSEPAIAGIFFAALLVT